MTNNVRGAATRQKILEIAVETVALNGFGATNLHEVADRAGLSSGAVYYHFESKEALAVAIIEEAWSKTWTLLLHDLAYPGAGLESVIRMTFSLTELLLRDDAVRLAYQLAQAFGDSHAETHAMLREHLYSFTDAVFMAVRPCDISDETTLGAVANHVWLLVYGSHHLARMRREDHYVGLAENWMILLRSVVPAESLSYFEKCVARTAEQFGSA